LNLTYSPSLIPEWSQFNVLVNGEPAGTTLLPKEQSGGLIKEFKLDPRLFVDFNRLTLQFIGHYTRDCEDPLHSTLWLVIDHKNSEIELTYAPLALPNDLSVLPRPFFDNADRHLLELPFVFAGEVQETTLKAAGLVASWFGIQASYRGANFPVRFNELPKGNAVVFVTGGVVPGPWFDAQSLPGAGISLHPHPDDPYAKLLVVSGRSSEDLLMAAQALALGQVGLSGQRVAIEELEPLAPRQPYDAPAWIPTQRPVKFDEIIPNHWLPLEVTGLFPDLIRMEFRIPPDLFFWRTAGVPLRLKYRYANVVTAGRKLRSSLNINLNGRFVDAFPLEYLETGGLIKMAGATVSGPPTTKEAEVSIPANIIASNNEFGFHYFFDFEKEGSCKDVILNNQQGAIDRESVLDFSQFPHYTALPNLAFFANSGFPYSRMADLSETAIILPERPDALDIQLYLMLMGRIGYFTGYPPIRVVIGSPATVEDFADKDLLVLGAPPRQSLYDRWAKYMPIVFGEGRRTIRWPGPLQRLVNSWEDEDREAEMKKIAEILSATRGDLAALVSFESPLAQARTVVTIAAAQAGSMEALLNTLVSPEKLPAIQKDVSIIRGDTILSAWVGQSYYVGSLPFFTAMLWFLSRWPWVTFLSLILGALLLGALAYQGLKRYGKKRLAGS
jgi:hypothetical protein